MRKSIASYIIKYFLQGLLLTAPLAFTITLTYSAIQWFDDLLQINTPGIGLLILLGSITFLGFLASTIIIRPLYNAIDYAVSKTPFLGIIYTSIKDLFNAFVGNDKKFNQPVLVKLHSDQELEKIGFITQADLSQLAIEGKVAVYLPHSYDFSGELFIVPSQNVTALNLPATEVMKFIVSGGVAKLK